jgi:hypothetical protein
MSPIYGPSRHFVCAQQSSRFQVKADIKWQAGSAGSARRNEAQRLQLTVMFAEFVRVTASRVKGSSGRGLCPTSAPAAAAASGSRTVAPRVASIAEDHTRPGTLVRRWHRLSQAPILRLPDWGDLLNAASDRAAAEQSYYEAIAIARRQSTKLFELRAATNLARLWRDQGKRNEACELLAPIYGWFTEGFETPVL